MKKLSRYLLLSFASLAVFFVAFFVMAKPASAACSTDDTANFLSAGELRCGRETYKYDPVLTLRTGFPSFVEDTGDAIYICDSGNDAVVRSLNSGNSPCDRTTGDHIGLEHYNLATEPFEANGNGSSGGPFCSLILPNNCQPWNGGDFSDFQGSHPPGPFHAGPTAQTATMLENIRTIQDRFETLSDLEVAENSCEDKLNSPLSFVVCPVMNFLQDSIAAVVDGLSRLLVNPNLTSSSALRGALQSTINIANSFYIIIFLIIIIANFIALPGVDSYTIKKTLPKLIAAIILTQFSLLICQTILDLGNILGVQLPSAILQAFGISGTPGQAFADAVLTVPSGGNIGDIFETLGQFLILGLVLLTGLIVGIISFFYLIARYLFTVLLVLTAPFAFAAWVLPNTEQLFKKWWSYFIKLSLMFLLVNLLFAGGAIFKQLLTDGNIFSGGGAAGVLGDFLTSLVGICVPLVVLALVPKTLKVSGDIMSKTKDLAKAAVPDKVKEGVKKSAQEGKIAEQKGKAYEGFGKSKTAEKLLGAKRAARLEAKGAGLKTKGSEKLKSDVGELGLSRQIALQNSPNKDVANAAKRAVTTKKRELLNTRTLDAQQLVDLERLQGKSIADIQRENPQLNIGTKDDEEGKVLSAPDGYTIANPYYNLGGGGTTPPSGTAPTSPPSGGGGTTVGGLPAGARGRRTGAGGTRYTPPAPAGGTTPPSTPPGGGTPPPGGLGGTGSGGTSAGGAAGAGGGTIPPVI